MANTNYKFSMRKHVCIIFRLLVECGGRITSATTIRSPMNDDTYFHNLNCTWIVEAPSNQVIDIKFQNLTFEGGNKCAFDFIAIYDGLAINDTQLLGRFCGSFAYQLPRVKTRTSRALIQFHSDWSISHGGFTAAIRFTPGEQQGCGGVVNLTSVSQQQLRAPDAALNPVNGRIEGDLDCQWTVLTRPGKVIRLQFTQIDMEAPSTDGSCSGDFIEVRDGAGASASLIGSYCGTSVAPAFSGSTNIMWIRLSTTTSNRRANFVATLSHTDTVCGSASSNLEATGQMQVLSSPGYPERPATNLRCRWLISSNQSAVNVHFQQLDVGSITNGQCSGDRIEVEDVIQEFQGNEALSNLVLNGERVSMLDQHRVIIQREMGQRLTFCGTRLPHDVISSGRSLAVTFITGDQPLLSRGFQLEYSMASCNRSYDGIQGRVVSSQWRAVPGQVDVCQFRIEAPENTTISLYFSFFGMRASNNCSSSSLEVRDGSSSDAPLLANVCGYALPASIHSSSNHLWLKSRRSAHFVWSRLFRYDLTYTTSNQGSGCGGAVFNTRGTVTSWRFPGNSSRASDCRWEITVPQGWLIAIEFTSFLFGPDCTSNYVEIFDVQSGENAQEAWRARYCGNDEPAVYIGTTNGATVRYVTSANNTGPGWRLSFTAVSPVPAVA